MPTKVKENSGYKVVGVTTPTQVVPDAEMLTRDDLESGRWTVHSTTNSASEVGLDTDARTMFVPTYDDELSRHLRAQQMFYAKCSPTPKQYGKLWAKRGYASTRTLGACEQLRMTTLMMNSGFEPHKNLQRGSEMLDGFTMATHHDFQAVVLGAISYHNTQGEQAFLDGVKAVHPEWIEAITTIANQASDFYNAIEKNNTQSLKDGCEWRCIPPLNATGATVRTHGFGYTEQLAKWVENIIGSLTDEGKSQPKLGDPQQTQDDDEGEGKKAKSKKAKSKEGEGLSKSEMKALLRGIKESAKEQQQWGRGSIPRNGVKSMWEELRVSKPALTKSLMGAIGKKRVASATGRNPRRMSRLLTDPERRIFDRTVRGAGGVVLVDTSGSMSLSEEQVKQIVVHAPSALVAQYSGGSRTRPNLYVIANKGRMVDKLPRPNGSNGMDFPALEWAIKQRQRPNAPVIWVSDGGVTGRGDNFCDDLTMVCIRLCKKQGVYVVPDPDTAIDLLKRLQRGEKVTSVIPHQLKETYKQETGQELVLR
jgi:hypothetical protein